MQNLFTTIRAAFFAVLFISGFTTFGQTIVGEANPTVGVSYNYQVTRSSGAFITPSPTWNASAGTVSNLSLSADKRTAFATVVWNMSGSDMSLSVSQGTFSAFNTINVVCNTIATPTYSISQGGVACSPTTFTISASSASGTVVRWYYNSGDVTPFQTGSGFTTPTVSTNATYYISAYNGSSFCESGKVAVTVSIATPPTAPTFVFENNICGSGSAQIIATPTGNGNQVNWYAASSGGSTINSGAVYNTPTLSAQTTYYITSLNTSTGCESSPRTPVVVNVYAVPTAPSVSNQTFCGATNVTLSGSPGANGNVVYWYNSSNTYIGSGNSFNVGTLSSTTTYYAKTLNTSTNCYSSSSTSTITINTVPSAPSVSNQTFCGATSVTFTSAPGANGNAVYWYNSSNSYIGQGNSFAAGTISSTQNFYAYTVNTSTNCYSPSSAFTITINAIPSVPTVTNQTFCAPANVTLSATPGSGGNSINWYNAADALIGTGTSLGVGTLSSTTSYYPSTINTTTGCVSGSSTLTVTINTPSAPTVSNQTFCGPASVTFTSTPGANGNAVYWYNSSNSYIGQGNSFAAGTISSTQNFYAYTVNTATNCYSPSSAFTITINAIPTAPTFTFESYVCGTGSAQITAMPTGSGNQVKWYSASSGGSAFQTSPLYNTPTLSTQTTYYITSFNSTTSCESSPRTPVVVSIYPIPSPPNLTNQSVCGPTAITLSGTPGANGNSVTWFSSPNNWSTSIGTGNTLPVGILSSTTTYYAITGSPQGCVSPLASQASSVITINTVPSTPTSVTGGSVCTSGTVTLTAAVGANGNNINWYTVSTGGTLLFTGTSYSPNVTTTTTYYAASYNSTTNCESARVAAVATVNTVPTASITAATICSGSATTISVTNPNNVSGTTLSWTAQTNNASVPALSGTGNITGLFFNDGTQQGTATYTVTPSTSSCTGTPVTATVTIKTAPPTPDPDPLLVYGSGGPLTYTIIVPSGYQAAWYNNPNAATPLSTQPSYSITFNPLDSLSSVTWVSLTDLNSGCESPRIFFPITYVASISPASVTAETIRVPGMQRSIDIDNLSDIQKRRTVTFIDGLGRSNQMITMNASPMGNAIIQPVEYDSYGRTSKSYLPYAATATGQFVTTYSGDQANFYGPNSPAGDKVVNDNYPFAISKYEASPLGRLLEQGNVGQFWQPGGHTKKMSYSYNTGSTASDADEVRRFASDGSSTGYYAVNQLSKVTMVDENGNIDIVFSNSLGKTIAKKQQVNGTTYLQTYYVYDDFGQLKYIIPPAGYAALKANSWTVTATITDNYFHQFLYDNRGRLKQKKTPNQAWSYLAYDNMNRLVLSQDGNLRQQSKWAFTKYDLLGRAVMSGLYINATLTDQASAQTLLNGLYPTSSTPYFEKRGAVLYGYTNQSFPTTNADNSALEVWNVGYFDDYNFTMNSGSAPVYDNAHLAGLPQQTNPYLRGFATGSRKRIVGTNNWIVSAVFYDCYGRAVQTQANNHLNLNGIDKTSVAYDFEGKALQTKTTHTPDGTNVTTVLQTPTYDTQGRLRQVNHSINGAPATLLAQYNYNELGQMVEKNLHGQAGTLVAENLLVTQYNGESNLVASKSIIMRPNYDVIGTSTSYKATITNLADINSRFLQNVDYRYNIRGQLTSINNAQLTNDGVTNTDTNDYFGMELNYEADAGIGNTPYYNGNISAVKWKGAGATSGQADQRSYKYAYDQTDRLTAATFQKSTLTDWSAEQNTLNENMSYDLNGNINSLTRNQNKHGLSGATVTSTAQTIDNLTYTYAAGNQLGKVADASAVPVGFNDGANSTTEYTYDPHGNLIADANKGIDSIKYNALGKAYRIKFHDGRLVTYSYDAGGNKLKMATTISGTTTTTDYINGFVYNTVGITTSLAFFTSPEGRVVKNGSNYEYQYAIADHQGNTRVLFTSATTSTQSVTAGFETANQGSEANSFTNYQTGAHINTVATNAHSGSNSLWLNGGYAGQVGVAKTYPVYPGDKLNIQAYAKYSASSGSSNLAGFATALLAAFNLPTPGGGEIGTASSAINTWGGIAAGGFGDGTTDQTDPKVFVNIILFDKNYNFIDVAYAQLTAQGALMSANYTVKEPGYAYLYVSNENPTLLDAYFDDVTMSYTPTNILQYSEYYPYGLQTANSWTRNNSSNNFLYDEGSELNATTGMYDLPFRNYDATLGRFFQVDPLAHMDASTSPFVYAGNNPLSFSDPSGLLFTRTGTGRPLDPSSYWSEDDPRGSGGGGSMAGSGGGGRGGFKPDGVYYDANGDRYSVLNGQVYIPSPGYKVYDDWDMVPANEVVDFGDPNQNQNYVARAQAAVDAVGDYLDPSTIGHNLLWLTYPGGDNPRSYNRKYNYTYVPKNKSEYPAISHDRRYDKLGTSGLTGLLTDTRAIGADWLFVAEELNIANDPSQEFEDRAAAFILGNGLGAFALPKTVFQLIFNPSAIISDFAESNRGGVTNKPTGN